MRGINSKKPKKSVTKPGTINKQAASAIDAPEIISNSGIYSCKDYKPQIVTCLDLAFSAIYIPMIAVRKIKK